MPPIRSTAVRSATRAAAMVLVLTPWALTLLWVLTSAAGPRQPHVTAHDRPPSAMPMAEAMAPNRPPDHQVLAAGSRQVADAPSRADRPSPPPQLMRAPQPEPTPQQPVPERFYGDRDARAIALTFDDGPSPELTPLVLEVLHRHQVRATFFVLGERAERFPELVSRAAAEGHEIGSHAWTHASLRALFQSEIESELRQTTEAIQTATGRAPALFRPPFGRYAPSALPLVAAHGMSIILWSIDAKDWKSDDPDAIARSVLDAAVPGGIVLLHDTGPRTFKALPAIITGLRADGYEILPVSELTGLLPWRDPAAVSPRSR